MKIIPELLITIVAAILSIISTASLLFLPLAAAEFIDEAFLASFLKTNAERIGNTETYKGYLLLICFCALIPVILSTLSNYKKAHFLSKISLTISAIIIVLSPFLLITVFFEINLLESKPSAIALTFLLFLCMQSYPISKCIMNLNKGSD